MSNTPFSSIFNSDALSELGTDALPYDELAVRGARAIHIFSLDITAEPMVDDCQITMVFEELKCFLLLIS